MSRIDQIKATEAFVRRISENYDSGHDWWHIERVRKLALFINDKEFQIDPFLVEITVLLHDCADSKFAGGDTSKGYAEINDFLGNYGMTEIKERVMQVIRNVSFSNKSKEPSLDPLLFVIRDADRLDAIGAIGIARAFNYGGFRNNPIYIAAVENEHGMLPASTIRHFYDKLLKLKDLMHTSTAKEIAGERHAYLEQFLKQFYKEWHFMDKHV